MADTTVALDPDRLRSTSGTLGAAAGCARLLGLDYVADRQLATVVHLACDPHYLVGQIISPNGGFVI